MQPQRLIPLDELFYSSKTARMKLPGDDERNYSTNRKEDWITGEPFPGSLSFEPMDVLFKDMTSRALIINCGTNLNINIQPSPG